MAFFSTWGPHGTTFETLVAVKGRRWSIEDEFETAKNELGLDHNETRCWHGWHRHVSLVVLTFAMLATIRHHANARLLRPQKDRKHLQQTAPDPLVKAGNPSHRRSSGPAKDRARARRLLVPLATRAPSHGETGPSQTQNATVTLGERTRHAEGLPAKAKFATND